ncbi:MAG TPA: PQQ-dependent sugar dehydrogenase, partial [Thermoleophilaceae bacterium]|nr:PQQ-dependent sugar dehydrogenase [Thermoleophilaceae bacterium]
MRTVVLAATLLLATAACADAARPDPNYPAGFSERVLVDGLQAPTAVAWTPDGRMLIVEKGGVVKVATRASADATEILDISGRVNAAGDRGLLGVAVDANYGSGA